MMGQRDDNPVPPHAITMWLTDHDIIAMLPMTKGGTPYMIKMPLNEAGLMRALEMLKVRKHEILSPTQENPANYTPPKEQPQVRMSKAREKLIAETTPAQREAAQALLRKLGLVKP